MRPLETAGRMSVGTSAVGGLDLPLGEDLRVRVRPAGHLRLSSLCRRETEAGEDKSSMLGPPSRAEQSLVWDVEGPRLTDNHDLTLGLEVDIRPQVPSALLGQVDLHHLPSPIHFPLRWGPAFPEWKQMF